MATHWPEHRLRLLSISMTLPVMFSGSLCTRPLRLAAAGSLQTGRSCSIIASAFAPSGGAGFAWSWAKAAVVNRETAAARRVGFFTREQTDEAGDGFHECGGAPL